VEKLTKYKLLPIFFGIAACSWVPHWSCHYYRLETESSFVVGNLHFSALQSLLSMLFYSLLITFNLASISFRATRFMAAFTSGIIHLLLGFIHISRIINPFNFEVFGFEWPISSSIREIFMVIPFGVACIAVSITVYRSADDPNKHLSAL
jgi:hypothetical protein